jgi:hypothetical protein
MWLSILRPQPSPSHSPTVYAPESANNRPCDLKGQCAFGYRRAVAVSQFLHAAARKFDALTEIAKHAFQSRTRSFGASAVGGATTLPLGDLQMPRLFEVPLLQQTSRAGLSNLLVALPVSQR